MDQSFENLLTVRQVVWVLVAIPWGALKIRGATAQLPRDIFEQENDWTFGQIVPVLLLVVPIFGTIIHLASNGTGSDPSGGHDHETPGAGAHGAHGARKPYPFATQNSELHEILTDDYSSRARWLWPSLGGLFLSAAYFTYEAFSHNFGFAKGPEAYGSLVEVWFTRMGLLWYIIFGLPCILSNTVAIGLALDAWFESPSKLATRAKIAAYQVLAILMATAYAVAWLFLVYFGFQSYLFKGLYVSDKFVDKIGLHVLTCMIMALLYYGFYLLVAFSVRLSVWKGTQDSIY